jgi:hypothetical protein
MRWAGLLVAGALLSGCASTVADNLPPMLGGLPTNTPARPAGPQAYPPVHDTPPPRQDALLTDAEVKQIEADMVKDRERANPPVDQPATQKKTKKKPTVTTRAP